MSLESQSSNRTHEIEGEEVRRRRRSPRQDKTTPRYRDKFTTPKFRDLNACIDAINTDTSAPITVDALIRQTEPSFTESIMRTKVSSKFKFPAQLGIYERKTGSMDHLDSFKNLMSLQGYSYEVMCKAFYATLKRSARSWLRKLPLGTINSFGDLNKLFVANFMSCRVRKKNVSYLSPFTRRKLRA
ncbi:hypothetical protein Acr_13g0002810 [Actinidia rufa]|uniref:Retrotransposon gag domain-containing protein n=1 Tax=Actinidia rufa TaxID=165716 RepID=A0A7J0FJL9_9ERIC|nr:hypothetical protein Acr_13g0002810 [Actinidia rufa]